jgi:hypothetical protein
MRIHQMAMSFPDVLVINFAKMSLSETTEHRQDVECGQSENCL